jgi:hypothetical protein
LPVKAETFRPLAATADVFFIEGVDYGAFRGATVTTTEVATGSIKAKQRRPSEGEKKTEQDRGKKPSKTERKKIHRAKKNRENANKETQKNQH